jgi:CheY-like chemotaxis protein
MAQSDSDSPRKIPITIVLCVADADERIRTTQVLEGARLANTLRFVSDGAALLDYLYQRGPYAGEQGLAPRPGLIVLDLDGPTVNGADTLRRIRADPALRTIPVAVLATSSHHYDVQECVQQEITAFMQKPVTLSRLLDAVYALDRYWLEIVALSPRVR